MTRLLSYALAIAVGLGTTAMLTINNHNMKPGASAEAGLSADGAFRDGLYLGNLAAQGGQPLSPAIGRWSSDHDRYMFRAGYLRGYNETVARAGAGSDTSSE